MNKKKETDFLQELFNIIQNKAKGKDNKSYTTSQGISFLKILANILFLSYMMSIC